MKAEYQYMRQVSYLDSFTVENIGNCIIHTFTDDGTQRYLITRTVLGVSRVLKCGPIQSGAHTICSSSFEQFDYDEKKLNRCIERFVADDPEITQVEVLEPSTREDYEDITNSLPDIRNYLYD